MSYQPEYKRIALEIIKDCKAAGLKISAISIEGHCATWYPQENAEKVADFVRYLTTTGKVFA